MHPLKQLPLLAYLAASAAFAQTPHDVSAAQNRYQQDMTACAMEKSAGGKANCTKEARNSLAETKRGRMGGALTPADYEKNALVRCDVHKGEDKADCIARIQGQGKIEGSVAGGGILRELTTTKTIAAPAPVPPPTPAPRTEPPAERPSGLMSNCRWVPPTDWVCK
jgi:hypothetical protein